MNAKRLLILVAIITSGNSVINAGANAPVVLENSVDPLKFQVGK